SRAMDVRSAGPAVPAAGAAVWTPGAAAGARVRVAGAAAGALLGLALRPPDTGDGAITLMSGSTVWACALQRAMDSTTATAGAPEAIAAQPRHDLPDTLKISR